MVYRCCSYITKSGEPCQNPVSGWSKQCAAGHPVEKNRKTKAKPAQRPSLSAADPGTVELDGLAWPSMGKAVPKDLRPRIEQESRRLFTEDTEFIAGGVSKSGNPYLLFRNHLGGLMMLAERHANGPYNWSGEAFDDIYTRQVNDPTWSERVDNGRLSGWSAIEALESNVTDRSPAADFSTLGTRNFIPRDLSIDDYYDGITRLLDIVRNSEMTSPADVYDLSEW